MSSPPVGPLPPPQPVFTCADITCPGVYQCEVEVATNAITCLEPRCPVAPAGGGATGGGATGGGATGGGATGGGKVL